MWEESCEKHLPDHTPDETKLGMKTSVACRPANQSDHSTFFFVTYSFIVSSSLQKFIYYRLLMFINQLLKTKQNKTKPKNKKCSSRCRLIINWKKKKEKGDYLTQEKKRMNKIVSTFVKKRFAIVNE